MMKVVLWWWIIFECGIVLCSKEADSKKNYTDSIMRMETQIRSVRAKFVLKQFQVKEEEQIASEKNLGTRIFEEEKEIREIIENEISNITDDDLDKVRSLNMLKEVVTNFDIKEKSEVLHAIEEKVKSLKAGEVGPHPKNIYKGNPTVIEQVLVEDAKQHKILEEVPKTLKTRGDIINVESEDENEAISVKVLPSETPIVSFEHTYGFDEHTSAEVIETHHDDLVAKLELPEDNKKPLIPLGPTFEYSEKEEEDGDEEIQTKPGASESPELHPIHIPAQPADHEESSRITVMIPEPTFSEKVCALLIDLFTGHPPLAKARLTLAKAPSPKRKRDTGPYCACDELKKVLFGPTYM